MMELIRAATSSTSGAAQVAAIWTKNVRPLAVRGVVLMTDQVVSSGTNFLTTIILGRACLPEELGFYSLGFSLVMLLMRVPSCLVWTPYTSFMPVMTEDDRRHYSGSALVHLALLCIMLAGIVSAIGVGMMSLNENAGLSRVLIVLGPAMALMLLREHARNISFARLRASNALLIDVAVAAIQTAGMLLLAFSGTLTAVRAYLVIFAAGVPVVTVWILASRHALQFRRSHVIADFAKNWRFARWLLASVLVLGCTEVLGPWGLTVMHGPSAVGVFAAALSIISLSKPLVLSFQNFFRPHAAHVFAKQGFPGLFRTVIRATLAVTGIAAVFTLGIVIWGDNLLIFVYGGKYAGQGGVVTALVLAMLTELVTLPTTFGLIAVGRGDILLKSYFIQLVLAVTVGLWCIYQFGPAGVGYSGLTTGFAASLWRWLAFWRLATDD
jgi:O-antigen/teichoic acid export membrane protein